FFADKRNPLNRIFAKWGWAWTTAVFFTYVLVVINRRLPGTWPRFALRWGMATLYWYLLTQWAFGPSFFDRVFVGSGGRCAATANSNNDLDGFGAGESTTQWNADAIFSYAQCRRARGTWTGGHDISGHCMLLVHASLFLWEELSPYLFTITLPSFASFHPDWTRRLTAALVVTFIVLWYTMLVVTATFYHSIREKFTGLIFGFLYWFVAYLYLFPSTTYPGMPVDSILDDPASEETDKRK
ncbi:Fat storage-inducing transmembrane protein, partial [Dimargaris cristalligena]